MSKDDVKRTAFIRKIRTKLVIADPVKLNVFVTHAKFLERRFLLSWRVYAG